jgi:signal transduction histidine kinase
MAAAGTVARLRLAGVAVFALTLAYAIAAINAVPRSAEPLTSYAGASYAHASTAAHAADLAAGLGLLAAGLLAWVEPRTRRLGVLALLAGVAWFGPDWDGWDGGPPFVRSLGAVVTPFFLALLFQLVLALPLRRVRSWPARFLVVAAYGAAAFVSLGRALFRNPFLDPYCWRNCRYNSFLVHADPGVARTLDDVWVRSSLVIGLLLVVMGAWRLLTASGPARRVLLPTLVPGVLAGAGASGYALALLRTPLEDPRSAGFLAIFLVLSLSVAALALGLARRVLETRRTRGAVARLASELGEAPPPGTLRGALAVAVGDPALEVAYWLPGAQRLVDGRGKPMEDPVPGHGRTVTPIVRDGRPVALVVHDAALLEGPALEREIGSAARLAVDNERLQAEVLAQLEDLRASRARIVETGDAERRRLERDLHDGAQQRLLALSYDLRLARAAAEADGDRELATLLASGSDEAQAALGELRDLAHGIYPAILAEAGLAPALATLADEAPLPVELGEMPPERYSAPVETAVYLTVSEAIGDAVGREATSVSLDVARENDQLIAEVRDDGSAAGTSALLHIADRVGALGGSLEVGPHSLRAEIPCE